MTDDVQHYKIIFLGDQCVGKSSILNRFYQDRFEPEYQATIGLDFHSKNATINGSNVRLLLYDTAGQEKFKSLIPMYIRDANIIIVVYDITLKDSFTHTSHWVNETKDLKRDDAIFCLVGNKIDLEDKRTVTTKEAEDFAKEKGFLFMEVSAKSGMGIQELFTSQIFPEMIKKFKIGDEENVQEGGNLPNDDLSQAVKLGAQANNPPPKPKKGGCCGGGKSSKPKLEEEQPDSNNEQQTPNEGGSDPEEDNDKKEEE